MGEMGVGRPQWCVISCYSVTDSLVFKDVLRKEIERGKENPLRNQPSQIRLQYWIL